MRLWFVNGIWASKSARQKVREIQPEQVKSIAIIRHAALGDMLLTRPFIYECRKFFPNAKITLSIVSNYTRGAPEDLVDRVHVAIGSDQRGVSKSKQVQVAKELGYHDLIFDLAATSRSFWLLLLNKAQLKIGFPHHLMQMFVFYDIAAPRSDLQYEADAMLGLLNVFGAKTSMPLNFALDIPTEKAERPYIVYFTSGSAVYKCWPEQKFIELIDSLSRHYPDMDHIVLEGVGDEESVENIRKHFSDSTNVYTAVKDSVEETTVFLANAALVISNDTGIRHLAIAAGAPSLGIFAVINEIPSAPFRYWPRFGRHDVVFNIDGTWPDASKVEALAISLLAKK